MLFLDLEFYIPPSDRTKTMGSLIFNPTIDSHKILGGYFVSKSILSEQIQVQKAFWLWECQSNESLLLTAITDFIAQQWQFEQDQKVKILGKDVEDLIICGFRSSIDLSALYIRSTHYQIKSSQRLYDLFFKPKLIDLANISSFLFLEDPTFYPKTVNEVVNRLQVDCEKKKSGKTVWDYYDAQKYSDIEKRTKQEVLDSILIYKALQMSLNHSNIKNT
jgi:hypothetical protein